MLLVAPLILCSSHHSLWLLFNRSNVSNLIPQKPELCRVSELRTCSGHFPPHDSFHALNAWSSSSNAPTLAKIMVEVKVTQRARHLSSKVRTRRQTKSTQVHPRPTSGKVQEEGLQKLMKEDTTRSRMHLLAEAANSQVRINLAAVHSRRSIRGTFRLRKMTMSRHTMRLWREVMIEPTPRWTPKVRLSKRASGR